MPSREYYLFTVSLGVSGLLTLWQTAPAFVAGPTPGVGTVALALGSLSFVAVSAWALATVDERLDEFLTSHRLVPYATAVGAGLGAVGAILG